MNGGLVGACECLSGWLPVEENGPLRPCIFWQNWLRKDIHYTVHATILRI